MKGDFSRIRFDKEKHYSEVLMQQGRVSVDADWNEQQAINRHRIETEAQDVIGKCGAPMNNAGFKITDVNNVLKIGQGRYYVDGILCENEIDIPYDRQPDLPKADIQSALGNASMWLVYLDVWKRHITALDDPLIREAALGDPDTTTRVKTIWQVKILPINDIPKGSINCNSQFSEWDKLVNSRTGTLNARTQPPTDEGPCSLPPTAGYQRLENQLYRIEIHKGGPSGTATFKWSRDNGSVVTEIDTISSLEITVCDIGPDNALCFANGQWVEICDEATELNEKPGQMVQIEKVNRETRKIILKSPTSFDNTHKPVKLRRWDSAGEIEVPADEKWISIESGIEVQFSDGTYKTGHYWTIPARTATGEIEWPPYEIPNTNPEPQRPAGILHHYCRLALVKKVDNLFVVQDCREIFPPLTGEPGIHVCQVLAGDKPLLNDTLVPVDQLAAGLRIEFDANVDLFTVQEKPTCFVTLDMPFPLNEADMRLWDLGAQFGYQPLILAANLKAKEKDVFWEPIPATKSWLSNFLFPRLSDFDFDRILAHLTLKGNFIWAQDNPERYLDGETFGFRGAGKDNIDIHLPSGNERRGGDFEMWFWLIPRKGSISGKKFDSGSGGQIQGWPIILKKDGTEVRKVTTDDTGNYTFQELDPGTYTIEEEPIEGWVQTTPPHDPITITPKGDDINGIDFGNIQPKGSISGRKFDFDNREKGLKDWEIILIKDNSVVDRKRTDENGNYIFEDLEPGTYTVQETRQFGWEQRIPQLQGNYTITITSKGEDIKDIDFGNKEVPL